VQAFVRKSTIVAWTLLAITALIAVAAGLLVFQAAADIENFREQLQQVEADLPEALEAVDIAQRAAEAATRTLDDLLPVRSSPGFEEEDQRLVDRARDREADAFAELDRADATSNAALVRAESLRMSIVGGESSIPILTVGGISAVVTSALLTVAFFAVSWFARALTTFPRRVDQGLDDESKDDA